MLLIPADNHVSSTTTTSISTGHVSCPYSTLPNNSRLLNIHFALICTVNCLKGSASSLSNENRASSIFVILRLTEEQTVFSVFNFILIFTFSLPAKKVSADVSSLSSISSYFFFPAL